MIDIYLIRHGKASSGWDNLNPDLDIIGKKQSNKIIFSPIDFCLPNLFKNC